MGIGMGIGGPAPAAYAANIAPPQAYGLTMGLVRAFGDVGYVAAPIFLGYLADYRGYTFSLGFAGYLLIVLAAAFGLWGREQPFGGTSPETD
jgi:MFS family permease